MPFDQGRIGDLNPDLLQQFMAQVTLTSDEETELAITPSEILLKFADWCYDQGVAEGMAEADTFAEQGR